MPAPNQTILRTTVPSVAVAAPGNSGPLQVPWGCTNMAVTPQVSAYTSGTITYEVQWSFDGTNFFSSDPKDTFTNLTAVAQPVKVVAVKAPYYRVTWTTGAYTHNIQDTPVACLNPATASGYDQGAGALGSVVTSFIPSKAISGTFVQGTTSTYSAIVPIPAGWGRVSLLITASAVSGTTPVAEIMWSFDGVHLLHGDPADTTATIVASTFVKEVAVKGPFLALAFASGTTPAATFVANALQSAA